MIQNQINNNLVSKLRKLLVKYLSSNILGVE